MKASEIRRLSTCAAQNHFFLQEASLLRWRLLLQRILQLFVKMSAEDRRRLYQRIDGRLGETLQCYQPQQQQQQQPQVVSLEALHRRFRSAFVRFLSTEIELNATLEKDNEEIHKLRFHSNKDNDKLNASLEKNKEEKFIS